MKTTAISLRQFLRDGAIYNLSLGSLIIGSMAYNAEIWLHDYPPEIQAKFGPKSETAEKQTRLFAIPFFLVLIGGIIYSNLKLKRTNNGRLSLKAAFLNAYGLLLSFWLFDLTILDWLLFTKIQPGFVVLPGTEEMAAYKDYGFHFKVAVPFLFMAAVPSLILGWLTANKR